MQQPGNHTIVRSITVPVDFATAAGRGRKPLMIGETGTCHLVSKIYQCSGQFMQTATSINQQVLSGRYSLAQEKDSQGLYPVQLRNSEDAFLILRLINFFNGLNILGNFRHRNISAGV